jgi:hypothetical protein
VAAFGVGPGGPPPDHDAHALEPRLFGISHSVSVLIHEDIARDPSPLQPRLRGHAHLPGRLVPVHGALTDLGDACRHALRRDHLGEAPEPREVGGECHGQVGPHRPAPSTPDLEPGPWGDLVRHPATDPVERGRVLELDLAPGPEVASAGEREERRHRARLVVARPRRTEILVVDVPAHPDLEADVADLVHRRRLDDGQRPELHVLTEHRTPKQPAGPVRDRTQQNVGLGGRTPPGIVQDGGLEGRGERGERTAHPHPGRGRVGRSSADEAPVQHLGVQL